MDFQSAIKTALASSKALHEDSVVYRAALPRFTVMLGADTFETDRADLAFWEGSYRNANVYDRHNLQASVIRDAA